MNHRLIEVGICTRPHGIKGALTIRFNPRYEGLLTDESRVFISPLNNSSAPELKVVKKITYGHKSMVLFEGVNSRSEAEEILPIKLMMERSALLSKSEQFLLEELLGWKVINFEGKEIGRISSIYTNGVQDVFEIEGLEKFDIPNIPNFVKKINLEEKEVTIVIPEYIDEE